MQTQPIKAIEFERPQMDKGLSCTAKAWARVPAELSQEERATLKERIKCLFTTQAPLLAGRRTAFPFARTRAS